MRYLVENVWNSQSILSAWDDLYDLTLVRWDKHEEWSPWNCILLTKEEASAHDKLEGLDEVSTVSGNIITIITLITIILFISLYSKIHYPNDFLAFFRPTEKCLYIR